jgi:hypothetical protein
MEQIYLVLDSNGIPIAQAVLESSANADVMQLRILQGSADTVTARRDVQLIGMDDRAQARRGLVIRQRGDQVVIQPTAALGAEARENLRILTDFESVIYPVTGRWKGFRKVVGKDLSCGGVAFYTEASLIEKEVVELVLPVTDEPLLLKVRMLRSLPSDREMALWAARFVDLILDEEIMIRKSVFSIQVSEKNID